MKRGGEVKSKSSFYSKTWVEKFGASKKPVDFMIGNSYGKELERDTKTPLIRIGFPIFDRHHTHRYSIHGYEGGINLLSWIVNKVLDKLDEETNSIAKTDYFFDLVGSVKNSVSLPIDA